jgi:TFIIF-interacting CTD phosphatase-like protein
MTSPVFAEIRRSCRVLAKSSGLAWLQPLNRRTIVDRHVNQNRLAYFIAALKLTIQSGDSTPEIRTRKEQPNEAACRSSSRRETVQSQIRASASRFAHK